MVPSPNWPKRLSPQHCTPRAAVTAHVSAYPADTETTPRVSPDTWTGVELLAMVPSPNSPFALSPQHWTPPRDVTAQVWNQPADIDVTREASPRTSTAVEPLVIVPLPNSPSILEPQHLTAPVVINAQA